MNKLFEVIKVDGANILTDKGGISLRPFSYADGGKTHPVDEATFMLMRNSFLAMPDLLRACEMAAQFFEQSEWHNCPAAKEVRAAIAIQQEMGRRTVAE